MIFVPVLFAVTKVWYNVTNLIPRLICRLTGPPAFVRRMPTRKREEGQPPAGAPERGRV